MEIWGLHNTDQVPWMRVQGWGPSGRAISDGLFLLGFCVSLRIWEAVGESSPSLISVLSRAGEAEADDAGGQGETPASTVRAACPVDPRSSNGLDIHLHSPQRLPQLWTLDLKAQCEVWELRAGPPECRFYHERGAMGCSPQTPLQQGGISNQPFKTGSARPPTRPDHRGGAGRQAGPPGPGSTFDGG